MACVLSSLGACLADDMGLGKTMQLLALEAAHRADAPAIGPTLLLCPMSLVGNWQREAARFTPGLRVYAHHGPQRLHGAALGDRLGEADLVVTTYATATRDVDELSGFEWRRLVLDEAQAIKNSRSHAAQAAKRLRADHRVALTGTPVETGWPSCGRSWTSSTRAYWDPASSSGPGTRSRSSATASPSRRRGCAPSPGRTCCAGSRPTQPSSTICRTR